MYVLIMALSSFVYNFNLSREFKNTELFHMSDYFHLNQNFLQNLKIHPFSLEHVSINIKN